MPSLNAPIRKGVGSKPTAVTSIASAVIWQAKKNKSQVHAKKLVHQCQPSICKSRSQTKGPTKKYKRKQSSPMRRNNLHTHTDALHHIPTHTSCTT